MSTEFELSPDARFVAAKAGNRPAMLYPVEGGDPQPIPGLRADDSIQPWTVEPGAILVMAEGDLPARVFRIDLATGARTLWREIVPPDSSGVWSMRGFRFQPDGQTYGYTYLVQLDDLYLMDHLR